MLAGRAPGGKELHHEVAVALGRAVVVQQVLGRRSKLEAHVRTQMAIWRGELLPILTLRRSGVTTTMAAGPVYLGGCRKKNSAAEGAGQFEAAVDGHRIEGQARLTKAHSGVEDAEQHRLFEKHDNVGHLAQRKEQIEKPLARACGQEGGRRRAENKADHVSMRACPAWIAAPHHLPWRRDLTAMTQPRKMMISESRCRWRGASKHIGRLRVSRQ